MRILVVHNYYQYRGGEESVFETEVGLLRSQGHTVDLYTIHNDQIGVTKPLALAAQMLWNRQVYQDLRRIICQSQPQIVHFHNTFPLISPSAYYAAKAEKVPVVQSLHNYRLLCPNALFFRQGKVCQDCLGKTIPLPAVIHACYRNSRIASCGVAAMLGVHTLLKTWTRTVDAFISCSQFALNKCLEGGIPPEKLVLKPNFLHPVPEVGQGQGNYALFVGRLSVEKGLNVMLKAWEHLGAKIPLKIVGEGLLASQVQEAQIRIPNLEWLGHRSLDEIYQLMGEATVLIFPSEWYETFGRVAIEALATGTPVIASNIGAIAELIKPYRTGLHFKVGDFQDLITQVEWVLNHPEEVQQMRRAARQEFEVNYTAGKNYQRLMEIYASVM